MMRFPAAAMICVWLVALGSETASSRAPRTTARAIVVADLASGEVLYRKGPKGAHAIASISKLMALRVAFAHGLDLNASTTMVESDWKHTRGGARTRLVRGREYLNRDLVHAALLGSDNRAVMALGRSAGLDRDAFVAAMNREARALGMTDTRFADPTGIDHDNVASPDDLIRLLQASSKHAAIAAITREESWLTSARERGGRPLLYRNTNKLVFDERRPVRVGKTGFNSAAGWCVASVLKMTTGRRVVVIVLGSRSKHLRFSDARRVLQSIEKGQ